jgi:hypothetical protein
MREALEKIGENGVMQVTLFCIYEDLYRKRAPTWPLFEFRD